MNGIEELRIAPFRQAQGPEPVEGDCGLRIGADAAPDPNTEPLGAATSESPFSQKPTHQWGIHCGPCPQCRAFAAAAPALLEACRKMLKLTGGSQYWTGETQETLEMMETAVAELRIAPFRPRARRGAQGPEPVEGDCRLRIGSDAAPGPIAECGDGADESVKLAAAGFTAVPAVVPEILSSVPVSVGCGLQMAGIEAEHWRK